MQGALIARDGRIWLLALAVPHTDQARRAGLRACKETPVRMRCDARHVFGVPKEEALQSVLAVLHNDNLGSVVDGVESVVEACVAMPVVSVAAVHRVELKLLHRRREGCFIRLPRLWREHTRVKGLEQVHLVLVLTLLALSRHHRAWRNTRTRTRRGSPVNELQDTDISALGDRDQLPLQKTHVRATQADDARIIEDEADVCHGARMGQDAAAHDLVDAWVPEHTEGAVDIRRHQQRSVRRPIHCRNFGCVRVRLAGALGGPRHGTGGSAPGQIIQLVCPFHGRNLTLAHGLDVPVQQLLRRVVGAERATVTGPVHVPDHVAVPPTHTPPRVPVLDHVDINDIVVGGHGEICTIWRELDVCNAARPLRQLHHQTLLILAPSPHGCSVKHQHTSVVPPHREMLVRLQAVVHSCVRIATQLPRQPQHTHCLHIVQGCCRTRAEG